MLSKILGTTTTSPATPTTRLLLFITLCAALTLSLSNAIYLVIKHAWSDERYSYILAVPLVAFALVFIRRNRIFESANFDPRLGGLICTTALATGIFSTGPWRPDLTLASAGFAAALLGIGAFTTVYGRQAAWSARFPLLLMLLAIPIPIPVLEAVEVFLQRSSADVTGALLALTDVPMFRDGERFLLPGISVEVARECSGIRSCIALVIFTLALSHLFLRSSVNRVFLVLLAVAAAIFKNGVRIATLSWLSVNVSTEYLEGSLHHSGGPLFSLIGIATLVPFFFVLHRLEERRQKSIAILPGRRQSA